VGAASRDTVLIEGCVIQVAGLAALTLTVAWVEVPTAPLLELVLAISFFAIEAARSARLALFASSALFALSIAACAAFLAWMRRAAPEIWIERHNPGD
jgi:hypothetical protein